MSKLGMTVGAAPATPPAGVVYLYAKTDGRYYFKADDGVEHPVKAVGIGTGDLLADGTVPLTGPWDAGPWKITAVQFESDVASGTPPLIVASNTVVANLNADLLDGQEGSYYASVTYVDASVVGLLDHKGGYNAATNTPDLDTAPSGIKQGDAYVVTVSGTFYSTELEAGDWMYANQDDPTAAIEWTIVQQNLEGIDAHAFLKSNLSATTDPGSTDDSGSGYGVGSQWINVTLDKEFVCLDATASNAVWRETTVHTFEFSSDVETVANQDYVLWWDAPFAGSITKIRTKSQSGTCTLTGKVNTTALGGTANSVSTSAQEQTHSSSNTFVKGDKIQFTISANSSCVDMSVIVYGARS